MIYGNLLNWSAVNSTTYVSNGLTITIDKENNTVTINGTCTLTTGEEQIWLSKTTQSFPFATVIYGMPNDCSPSTYYIGGAGIISALERKTLNANTAITCAVIVKPGAVCNNVIFRPSLKPAFMEDTSRTTSIHMRNLFKLTSGLDRINFLNIMRIQKDQEFKIVPSYTTYGYMISIQRWDDYPRIIFKNVLGNNQGFSFLFLTRMEASILNVQWTKSNDVMYMSFISETIVGQSSGSGGGPKLSYITTSTDTETYEAILDYQYRFSPILMVMTGYNQNDDKQLATTIRVTNMPEPEPDPNS